MNNEIWKCQNCNQSDYTSSQGSTTLLYYQPRIVNGVNVNPDRNTTTANHHCNICDKDTQVTYD